jgi:hypothetical protein
MVVCTHNIHLGKVSRLSHCCTSSTLWWSWPCIIHLFMKTLKTWDAPGGTAAAMISRCKTQHSSQDWTEVQFSTCLNVVEVAQVTMSSCQHLCHRCRLLGHLAALHQNICETKNPDDRGKNHDGFSRCQVELCSPVKP